ncbi:hypothetical protein [Anaerostipes sp.]
MLKIRMQGMTSDIEWFQKILEEDKRIRVLGKEQINIFEFM